MVQLQITATSCSQPPSHCKNRRLAVCRLPRDLMILTESAESWPSPTRSLREPGHARPRPRVGQLRARWSGRKLITAGSSGPLQLPSGHPAESKSGYGYEPAAWCRAFALNSHAIRALF